MHFGKQAPIFGKILILFKLHSRMSAKLCFAENTIKIVFSAEHSFCISQIVNPLPRENPTWHFCNQKCHLGFPPCLLTPISIFVVFGDSEWVQKRIIYPKHIVATKMRAFFYLPNTIVFAYVKNAISAKKKKLFVHNHPKTLFIFFFFVRFHFFHFFSFSFSNTKVKKKQKVHILFRKPFFDTLTNCQKVVFAPLHTICVF